MNAESEPWLPEDMAVLVRTNRQALLVKERLSAKGLPSVLYSTVNIFDSREAMEVEKILTGISEPDNLELLKAALAMDMMGAKGESVREGLATGLALCVSQGRLTMKAAEKYMTDILYTNPARVHSIPTDRGR